MVPKGKRSLCFLDIYFNSVLVMCYILLALTHLPLCSYMRQWVGSALVRIMACRLFGAKSLSKPMLGYCPLDPQELKWNFNQNTKVVIRENVSEYIVWKISATLSRFQRVNQYSAAASQGLNIYVASITNKWISWIYYSGPSCFFTLQNPIDDTSAWDQIMAWCLAAPLSEQISTKFYDTYGITKGKPFK